MNYQADTPSFPQDLSHQGYLSLRPQDSSFTLSLGRKQLSRGRGQLPELSTPARPWESCGEYANRSPALWLLPRIPAPGTQISTNLPSESVGKRGPPQRAAPEGPLVLTAHLGIPNFSKACKNTVGIHRPAKKLLLNLFPSCI